MTVLKSQVIQLERQVLLMSEALSSRSVTLTEVENALTWLADKWRYYIGLEIKGPEVNVQRSDLTKMVETAESARIKLYKNIENTSTERLARPLIFFSEFLKPDKQGDITLFDIASGKLDHLNLKHVGKLESKLAALYRELITLHDLMENGSYLTMSDHMSSLIRERTSTQLLKSCAMMKDCSADLMSMSLLYPSAPWPPLKRCCIKDITCEKVMNYLPNLPRSKANDVQRVIEALLRAINYRHYMVTQEVKSLKEDLKFHKSVYNLQISYIESLFNVVRDGYINFELSANEIVVKPLKDILDAFEDLHTTTSEGAFKEFLKKFKQNAEQLQGAVEKFDITDSNSENGTGALSQYGQEFFIALDKLIAKSQRARDKAAKSKEDLSQQQEKLEEELRNILDEQELKYQEHFVADFSSNSKDNQSDSTIHGDHDNDDCVNINDRKYLQKQESDDEICVSISDRKCVRKRETEDEICVNINQRKHIETHETDIVVDRVQSRMKSLNVNESDTRLTEEIPQSQDLMSDSMRNKISLSKETEEDNKINDSLPPQSKKQTKGKPNKQKQERKYVPNTFVPNRTLQLRRSGSLNKLSDQNIEDVDRSCDSQTLPTIKRSNSSLSVEIDDRSTSRKDSASVDRSQGLRRSESKERRTGESGSMLRTSTLPKKPPFR